MSCLLIKNPKAYAFYVWSRRFVEAIASRSNSQTKTDSNLQKPFNNWNFNILKGFFSSSCSLKKVANLNYRHYLFINWNITENKEQLLWWLKRSMKRVSYILITVKVRFLHYYLNFTSYEKQYWIFFFTILNRLNILWLQRICIFPHIKSEYFFLLFQLTI